MTSNPSIPQRIINQAYEEKMKRGNQLQHDQGFDSNLGHLRLITKSDESRASSAVGDQNRGISPYNEKTKSAAQLDYYIEE